MNFEPFTITGAQIFNTYVWAHLIFGLVTHYHSVSQVREFNKTGQKISSVTMAIFFVVRMAIGLPWFVVSRIISPIGNRWHLSADDIHRW